MKKVVLVFMAIMASLLPSAQSESTGTNAKFSLEKQGGIQVASIVIPLSSAKQTDIQGAYRFNLIGLASESEVERLLAALKEPGKVFTWVDSTTYGERSYSGFLYLKEKLPFSFKSDVYYFIPKTNTLKIERKIYFMALESTRYILLLAYFFIFLIGLFFFYFFMKVDTPWPLTLSVLLGCAIICNMPVETFVISGPLLILGLMISFLLF